MNLRPYQIKGVEHLLSKPFGKPHALLADDPGTGKTAMAIEAAKAAKCSKGVILCPSIIKTQWKREASKWGLCGQDEIQIASGRNYVLTKAPWLVINYDLVREPEIRKQITERDWHVLIADEAHRLKSYGSKQTNAVLHYKTGIATKCYWKWLLSGSIMPNRPVELYPFLKTMAPEVIHPYTSYASYLNRYCGGAFLAGRGASNIPELTEKLQPFILRRKLQDVWDECPNVIENEVWLDVPYTAHPEWDESEGWQKEATERRIIAEAKIPYVAAYLKERFDGGSQKIVCFTYHRKVADNLEKELSVYGAVKIYGGITSNKREANLSRFLEDADCRLLLIQIASGGEGLDGLQHVCAEYVYAEPEWSPGREDQAGRRILRLGQTKTVISTTLLASDSYEEIIYRTNKKKRKVIEIVTKPNGGNFVMSIEAELKRIADSLEVVAPLAQVLGQVLQQGINNQLVGNAAPQPVPQVQNFAPESAAPIAATSTVSAANTVDIAALNAPATSGLDFAAFTAQLTDKLKPMGAAGMDKCRAILAEFGVKGLNELPADKYVDFLAKV